MHRRLDNKIVCIGEVLWDALPLGIFLGGAPFNVACHLHMLGCNVAFSSRVGEDRLGHEVLRRLSARGIDTTMVQVDPVLETGFVKVEVDAGGIPTYDIIEPAAWDAIALTEALREQVEAADVIVFGTLGQRQVGTRETLQALWETSALKVFDVNLRPPYVDQGIVEASLRAADVVKLNDEELLQLGSWFGFEKDQRSAATSLASGFDIELVCVTRGADGAALWHGGNWEEHAGYRVDVQDTVGAGDAFLAGLLAEMLKGADDQTLLDFAARLGAFVATQHGATPNYLLEDLG